jgi:putative spermidine/putrescine transport system substrate-binding protein
VKNGMTRRRLLQASATAGMVAMELPFAATRRAAAAEGLVGVTWGGAWINATRPIADVWSKKTGARIVWELHEGSSTAVATKIKATWPTVKYDIVSGNDPLFYLMLNEGWLEPVDDLPNLKDVPNEFVLRDAQGHASTVPTSIDSVVWGYRTDLVKEPITALSQILEPRFKAKIAMRGPNSYNGLQIVSMALERGGNEKNIEPGFQFAKELATAGNISVVSKGGVDIVNAMNTGEASVAFASSSEWVSIVKNHPVKILTRVPRSPSLKAFYSLLHWGVVKGPRAALAKDFANYMLSTEVNEDYSRQIAEAPANIHAKTSPELADDYVGPEEIKDFAYLADWKYMTEQGSEWVTRFDTEVRPLLKRS